MIPPKLRAAVKRSAGGMCQGKYIRKNGHEVERVGNCGKEGVVAAHIKHAGMGHSESRDTMDNLLWLCWLHHELMDERITPMGYARLGGR